MSVSLGASSVPSSKPLASCESINGSKDRPHLVDTAYAAFLSNVGLFLPRFSDTLDATAGAGLLSAFNVSCIFAQLLWGFLTDVRWSPRLVHAISLQH